MGHQICTKSVVIKQSFFKTVSFISPDSLYHHRVLCWFFTIQSPFRIIRSLSKGLSSSKSRLTIFQITIKVYVDSLKRINRILDQLEVRFLFRSNSIFDFVEEMSVSRFRINDPNLCFGRWRAAWGKLRVDGRFSTRSNTVRVTLMMSNITDQRVQKPLNQHSWWLITVMNGIKYLFMRLREGLWSLES